MVIFFFTLLSLICSFQRTIETTPLFFLTEKIERVLSKLNRIRFYFAKVSCFPEELPSGRLPRKEVIQPQVLLRLPCYDFTPIADPTFGRWFLAVTSRTSGIANSHGVTGGVYKARERIHRDMLIRDY